MEVISIDELRKAFSISLPSGRCVCLNFESIDLRWAQREINVEPNTSHRDLFALVDVDICFPNGSAAGNFTGYSIADVLTESCKWNDADRLAFVMWIRSIEERIAAHILHFASGKPIPYKFQEHLPSDVFFSPLDRFLQGNMPRAPVVQWRNTLRNAGAHGIRDDEIVWSGLNALLNERHGQVLREELLGRLRAARTKLVFGYETRFIFDPEFLFDRIEQPLIVNTKRAPSRLLGPVGIRAWNPTFGYKVALTTVGDLFEPEYFWLALDERNRVIPQSQTVIAHADQGSAERAARLHLMARFHGFGRTTHKDHWRPFVLPGGTNYREWLLVMPDFLPAFYSEHFATPNVLLHLRTTIRRDLFGSKMLLVEELQSDWHEIGRRDGYGTGEEGAPPAPFGKSWHELGLMCALRIAASENVEGMALVPGDIQLERYPADDGLKAFYDEMLPRALSKLTRSLDGKVERTFVSIAEGLYYLSRKNLRWFISNRKGEVCSPGFQLESSAWRWLERRAKGRQLPVPFIQFNERIRNALITYGIPKYGSLSKLVPG